MLSLSTRIKIFLDQIFPTYDWRFYYVRFKAFMDRGINEVAWMKNIVNFVFSVSGIAYITGQDATVVAMVFTPLLLFGALFMGWLALERVRLVEKEIEYVNTLHGGVKTRKEGP